MTTTISDKEALLFNLEMALDYAKQPLSRPLEVGFRHSPLRQSEIVDRYRESCEMIRPLIEFAMSEIAKMEYSVTEPA